MAAPKLSPQIRDPVANEALSGHRPDAAECRREPDAAATARLSAEQAPRHARDLPRPRGAFLDRAEE
eukprot:8935514-Pyramimonas_sp.AAC.1